MKMKIIGLSSLIGFAALISACGGTVTVTNSANTANANKPAGNANANATTNSTNTANTNASNTSANSNKDSKETSSSTSGDSVSMDSAGIKMTLPKGFGVEKDGDVLTVTTPDKGFAVIFMALEGKDFASATKAMADQLDKDMKDVKVEEKDKKGEVNGMETISSGGTGVDKETGKHVVWKMAALNAPKKPVLATAIGDADSIEKHGKEIGELLDSVKKQ